MEKQAQELYPNNKTFCGGVAQIAREAFIKGARLQKEADSELIEIAYNDGIAIGRSKQKEEMEERWLKDRDGCFWDGVEEGKKAMREQMMNGATDGVVVRDINGELAVTGIINLDGFAYGDKVKIVVVKAEE